MDITVHELLEALRPVYNSVREKQQQLKALQDARIASEERTRILSANNQLIKDALERLRNVKEQKRAEKSRSVQSTAQPLIGSRAIRNISTQPISDFTATPVAIQALPLAGVQVDRVELKRMIGRFARYRLDQIDPKLLPEFNRLLNEPTSSVGQALAVLDWDATYTQPLHERETAHEWARRLKQWGQMLEAYSTSLDDDLDALYREYHDMLPLLEIWRHRSSYPAEWEAFIDRSQKALQDKLVAIEYEITSELKR